METGRDVPLYTVNFSQSPKAAAKEEPTMFRRWLDRFKEFVALTKDVVEVLLKISPAAFFPPALMLWSYLRGIGWGEVFLDSVGSIPGLVTLLAAALLLLFALFLQFCLPSLLLMPAAAQLDTSKTAEKIELRHLAVLNLLPALAWTLIFAIVSWNIANAGYLAVVGSFLGALAAAVLAALMMRKRFVPEDTKGRWKILMRLFAVAAFPILGSFASSSSLIAAIWVVEYQPFSTSSPVVVLIICCLISVVGLVPGVIYLDSHASNQSMSKTMVNTIAAAAGVGYFVVSSALFFAPVGSATLHMAGVTELSRKVYQVLKPELVYAMRAVHLPVYEVKRNAKSSEPPVFFVDAYLRFNFGGIKLLCATPYDPNLIAHQAALNAAKMSTTAAGASSTNAVDTPNVNAGEAQLRLEAGNWCLPVKTEDLKPIHRNVFG